MQGWIRNLLTESGFSLSQSIVMLEWKGRPSLPPSPPHGVQLRPMVETDLSAVTEVDADAFVPFWHNSLDTLRRAFSQAVVATVAESDGRVVGYQLSTGNPTGAHLARLAVRREAQGVGLGAALVTELIVQMRRRGAIRISVNTQNDNYASLKLYQQMGFTRTGEEFPVYRYQVDASSGG
jgi:ribosomal-protein-alanine N-acetyltransferase